MCIRDSIEAVREFAQPSARPAARHFPDCPVLQQPMLAAERHQLFAGVEGRWDVPSQDMDDPREPQRMPYSGQVLEITREVDRAARALDGLVGIAEHLSLIHISEPTRQAEISY